MRGLTVNVGVATGVFFLVSAAWRAVEGGGVGWPTVLSAVFFALTYGAVQVGLVLLAGNDKE